MRRPASRPDPATSETAIADAIALEPGAVDPTPVAAGAMGSLSDLPVAGLTRRRIALLIGALVAAWVIILFSRQVGEASEATARADAMRVANVQLESEVSALEAELELIQKQSYISLAAREYRLGKASDVPFALADDAPALADDAPGSARVRLGTRAVEPTPLESWARLLFGEAEADARD
jgi:cell division protein FtsB